MMNDTPEKMLVCSTRTMNKVMIWELKVERVLHVILQMSFT